MIQLATALPAISVGPVKPNAAISADVSGFALAMGALMPKIAAPGAGQKGAPADAAIPLPEGQDVAETGKDLPDAVLGLDGKGEEKPGAQTDTGDDAEAEDAPPPPFAWFAIAPPPAVQPEAKTEAAPEVTIETGGNAAPRGAPLPEVAAPELGEPKAPEAKAGVPAPAPGAATASTPVVVPDAKPRPAARADAPRQPGADTAAAPVAPAPAAPADTAVAPAAEAVAPAVTETDTGDAPAEPGAQPPLAEPPSELRKAAADAPVVRITLDKPAPQQKVSIADVTQAQRRAAAEPASQPVADQIIAAFELPQTRVSAGNAASDPQVDLSTVSAPATGAQTAAAVTATGQGQDAALDTRHQEWTSKMIDKIESLQGGPVRETRLSLMPEGLGKVDVSIRQDDGGALHVEFNTDTQAARQLIADAQPKLAEIAQERGIRIGSTSVESNAANGNGGGTNAGTGSQTSQGQRHDAQPQRNQPSAPPSARREARTSTDSDERVA